MSKLQVRTWYVFKCLKDIYFKTRRLTYGTLIHKRLQILIEFQLLCLAIRSQIVQLLIIDNKKQIVVVHKWNWAYML